MEEISKEWVADAFCYESSSREKLDVMPYSNFMGIDERTKVDAMTICERNGHSELGNMGIKLIEPSVRRYTPRDVLNVIMGEVAQS